MRFIEFNLEKLSMIDKIADNILKGSPIQPNLDKISNILSELSKSEKYGIIRFKLNAVENKTKTSFVMAVYPDLKELEAKLPRLIETLKSDKYDFYYEWMSIRNWIIEVDTRIFTDTNIKLDNGAQFTAILCHELSHVNTTHPLHLRMNYKLNSAKFKMYEKVIPKSTLLLLLFLPMFITTTTFKIVVTKPFRDLREIEADFLIPPEYKGQLYDYCNNHIIPYQGTMKSIIVQREEYDNEQKQSIEFSRSCIRLMKKRRGMLAAQIKTNYLLNKSPYNKEVCKLMASKLTGEDFDTNHIDLVKESYIEEAFNKLDAQAIRESETILEAIKVTDRDILTIEAQVDQMNTLDDKVYLINTICDFEESLLKQQKKNNKKADMYSDSKNSLIENKLKRLSDIKKKVMDTKIYNSTPSYGVFVKYPAGYEG